MLMMELLVVICKGDGVLSVKYSLFAAGESDVHCGVGKNARSHFKFHDYLFIYGL